MKQLGPVGKIEESRTMKTTKPSIEVIIWGIKVRS
jgi:hypothetical protein